MTRAAQTSPQPETSEQQIPPEGTNPELEALLKKTHIPVVGGLFAPDSLDGYRRLAENYLRAGLVPEGLIKGADDFKDKIARVSLVLEAGMGGLKLTAVQSMTYLLVVNNRVAVFGDAIPGLIWRSGSCAGIDETVTGEGDNYTCHCTISRMVKLPDGSYKTISQTRSFGVKDAKRAGLWGKSGPWTAFPQRMLQVRPRSFCARDLYADVLMGLGVVEELEDVEPTQTPKDKAAAATDAIDALKPAHEAPKDPTPPEPSRGNGWGPRQTNQTPKPEHPNAQPSGPAAKAGGDDGAANHEQEADAGNGQEQDNDKASREAGESAQMEDAPFQLTQGTDAEAPQVKPKREQKPKGGKSTGDANAEPPPGMLLGTAAQPTNRPPPSKPWHK